MSHWWHWLLQEALWTLCKKREHNVPPSSCHIHLTFRSLYPVFQIAPLCAFLDQNLLCWEDQALVNVIAILLKHLIFFIFFGEGREGRKEASGFWAL